MTVLGKTVLLLVVLSVFRTSVVVGENLVAKGEYSIGRQCSVSFLPYTNSSVESCWLLFTAAYGSFHYCCIHIYLGSSYSSGFLPTVIAKLSIVIIIFFFIIIKMFWVLFFYSVFFFSFFSCDLCYVYKCLCQVSCMGQLCN